MGMSNLLPVGSYHYTASRTEWSAAMATIRTRIIVEGRVQGVFFRENTRRKAHELGVTGWVRNLPDGRVEAVFEGKPEAVANAVAETRRGPERAIVTSAEEYADEEPEGLVGFDVRW
jgi:acylphosphatase